MENLIPIIAILCSVGLPIATGLVLGYRKIQTEHRERMGMINQGIIPPERSQKKKANPNRYVSLRNALVLMMLGVGIMVGITLSQYTTDNWDYFFPMAASIVFFLGAGYLIFFFVTKNMRDEEENNYDNHE